MSTAGEMRTAWHRTAATCYLLNEDSKRAPPKQSGDLQWLKQDEVFKPKSLGDGWNSIHSHYFTERKLDFHFHVENEGDSLVEVSLGSGSLDSSEWQTIDPPSLHQGTLSEKLASEIGVKKTSVSNVEVPKLSKSQAVPMWRHANKGELAALIAIKSSEDMGNCDLPAPSPGARSSEEVFDKWRSAPQQAQELASISSSAFQSSGSRTFMSSKDPDSRSVDSRLKGVDVDPGFLGEALCRSQTRAREAEKRAAEAVTEKEQVLKLFFREASLSLAYRHWIKFLEVENLWLRRQRKKSEEEVEHQQEQEESKRQKSRKKRNHLNSDHTAAVLGCTVGLAFALGVGLAGAGLVFGCTMGWILFAF